ncbi:hypothetical protein [Amycolatopsis sp. BJA-103]|uniref:hypothetical protein n=1 Tax=Amycolatopsis sp. BJA-103 TaxID=1911175 RepID=UPI0011AEEED5|nr:hypothetical protein [Amycolatopsis sp. BJA-103]
MLTERICHAGPRAGDGDDSGGYGLSAVVVFQSGSARNDTCAAYAVHLGCRDQFRENPFTGTDIEHPGPAARTALAGRREAASLAA